jgi:UDP-2,3-diacylglucosamine hydrolase
LPDPTVLEAFGQRILLTHGDALCLADREYQAFRAQVRNPEWQGNFLRLPLEQRRAIAAQARAESRQRGRDLEPQDYADVDTPAALQWLQAFSAGRMIHGHTHRPADHELAQGLQRHVLSDWDLDGQHPEDPARAEIMRLTSHGLARIAPASRADLHPGATS